MALDQIYYNVFGILGRRYDPDDLQRTYNQAGAYQPDVFNVPAAELSPFGTPYFQRTKINGVYLPNEPLVSLSGQKNIIRTAIDGAAGTFKENMSLDDYRITIRGICVLDDPDYPDQFPEDQVRSLRIMFEEKESVDIVNDLLTYFGITRIAVDSIQIEGLGGTSSMQPYIITGYSDKEIDLELTDL